MYTIYTVSGDRVRWAPVFRTTVEARIWLAEHAEGSEEPWQVGGAN